MSDREKLTWLVLENDIKEPSIKNYQEFNLSQ